jgi:signal transduction histidine kinase
VPVMTDDKHHHDFKNQLGIILGFSEMLLAEAAADDPRRDDFDEIHKAARAALDLLGRLFPIDVETQR